MLIVNLILAIFMAFIIHHIMYNITIIEGLDNNSSEDENINQNSTEYTAAKVNVELSALKKDISHAKERVEKMSNNMKDLSGLKEKMNDNTELILQLQKSIAELEADMNS